MAKKTRDQFYDEVCEPVRVANKTRLDDGADAEANEITKLKPELGKNRHGEEVNTLFAPEFLELLHDELLSMAMRETKEKMPNVWQMINMATMMECHLNGVESDANKMIACHDVIAAVNALTAHGFGWEGHLVCQRD